MSYRDLRNLLESLRTLGYPRLVSIENFRDPNFPLVAEILQWLTKRYDPEVELPFAIDSQQDRVIFIKAVARFLITKGGIRLNAKKLYRADGHAVREIIKLANVLTSAMEAGVGHGDGSTPDALEIDLAEFDLSGRENDLKATRTLASEITARGAALHELLEREVDLRESRSDAIARPLDVDEIESGVQRAMAIVSDEISRTQSMMENIGADEANLENKIEKSKADYERHCKKLRALENVRPPFMDEYEKIEEELQAQYTVYIERFRNLTYLENSLDSLKQAEQEKFEQAEQTLKHLHSEMQNNIRNGNAEEDIFEDSDAFFNGDGTNGLDSDEEFMNHDNVIDEGGGGRRRIDGDLGGGGDTESESEDLSNASDSDSDFLGGDDGNLSGMSAGSNDDSLSDEDF
eukprot:m.886677 g.886677  ORF g.886677 m.886677 type:complete len:405 (+) comp23628_c0_seq4:313-1527(+)